MSEIVIENAVKHFGKFVALDNVNLTVNEHEFVVLLGPSGCGKTTLLRAVAGLGMLDSGRVLIANRDVTYLQPRDRKISMVFQNYAIFPHMTVFDNIAFGLKMRKTAKTEIQERVQNAASLLHIESMLERYPNQMSGGQRQRIAVARAIAYQADVLLMDEPLSNLDALLRLEMRAELKLLLNRLGVTTVYVTHDQIEAMSMGDRIAVMNCGQILQYDHPTKVYDLPIDRFVGGFIGNPPMNYLRGQVQRIDGTYSVQVDQLAITPDKALQAAMATYEGRDVLVGIRAEWMETLLTAAADALAVTVEVVEPLGAQNLLTIYVGKQVLKVSTRPDMDVQRGQQVWLRFPTHLVRLMDAETGKALGVDLEKAMA